MTQKAGGQTPDTAKGQPGRELRAHLEIGRTEISRRVAGLLVVICALTILSEPLLHHGTWLSRSRAGAGVGPVPACYRVGSIPWSGLQAALDSGGGPYTRLLAANRRMQRGIDSFETGLDEEAVLGRWIRPRLQALLGARLGAGNEQVYCGRDGWLFYRPAIDHLLGHGFLEPRRLKQRRLEGSDWERPPQPDPRPAIKAFHSYLAERGITLVLMPVPVKASIHPEHMTGRLDNSSEAIRNPSLDLLLTELAAAGVDVFDPAPILLARSRAGEDQYLRTDTHWRPEAVGRVAEALADHIGRKVDLEESWSPELLTEQIPVTNRGDLAAMLELAEPGSWGGSEGIDDDEREASGQRAGIETVEITRVVTADDSRWQIDPEADVLVLGDSFANVFSLASMGWGDSAGLVEHLARSLGRPVDAIIRNDDAAFATREILARELARGRDRLTTKRVVVWELTARELSSGDWRLVPMEPGSPGPSRFVVPPDGETWIVSGTIAAMGPVPRPRSAPYPDYIVALHLVDLEIPGEPDQAGAEALVLVLAMEDSTWLPAAHYRIGQTLRLRLQSWAEKESELGLINRGEIYDDELIFQEPCWGEEVP